MMEEFIPLISHLGQEWTHLIIGAAVPTPPPILFDPKDPDKLSSNEGGSKEIELDSYAFLAISSLEEEHFRCGLEIMG